MQTSILVLGVIRRCNHVSKAKHWQANGNNSQFMPKSYEDKDEYQEAFYSAHENALTVWYTSLSIRRASHPGPYGICSDCTS